MSFYSKKSNKSENKTSISKEKMGGNIKNNNKAKTNNNKFDLHLYEMVFTKNFICKDKQVEEYVYSDVSAILIFAYQNW